MYLMPYSESLELLENLDVRKCSGENCFVANIQNRILHEDIVAMNNYPEFPTASMDGYAVKNVDLALGRLKVLQDNPAGSVTEVEVRDGTCIKTFTGSLMPIGADTLIPIENVTVDGNEIIINEVVPFGFSVRPVAESYSEGDVLIKKDVNIGFAHIGVMAGLNVVQTRVRVKPRVAILSTGSEILDVGQERVNSAQIRSSNHLTLAAIAKQHGAEAIQFGVVGDDKDIIKSRIEEALRVSDIVVTTGGVSVGDYDFVKTIVPAIGAKIIFQRVNIKPGRHILLAQIGEKFIVALPGFAYSSTVTFLLYVVPLIKRMLGLKSGLKVIKAYLGEDFKKRSNKTEFTACNLYENSGKLTVDFADKKVGSSAILTNLLGSAALMISGEEENEITSGALVDVIVLD